MANFETSYYIVEDWEGGYQAIPQDSGNYNSLGELVGTNWGINAQVYESWIGYPPTKNEMLNMSQAQAKQIDKDRFWDDIQGDNIVDQYVANIFFDCRVNHGRKGTRLMQEVLGVGQDGIVGPITLGAINGLDPAGLYLAYKQRRINFYHEIVANKPSQSIFLNGWLNRINSFTSYQESDIMVSVPSSTPNQTNSQSNKNEGLLVLTLFGIGTYLYFNS